MKLFKRLSNLWKLSEIDTKPELTLSMLQNYKQVNQAQIIKKDNSINEFLKS